MKKKTNVYLENVNLNWGPVDIEYDSVRNCEDAGCDYICRCVKIVNEYVTKVSIQHFITYHFAGYTTIYQYAADRLLRLHKAYDKDSYRIYINWGYYGEEIDGVYWDNAPAFDKDFQHALSLKSNVEVIKFLLEKEYDMPAKENYTFCSSIITPVNSLEFTTRGLRKKDSDYELVEKLPIGIYKKVNSKYVVIDGNNRLSKVLSEYSPDEEVEIYVVS